MRNILIVVDYQNDFVSGSLGFKQAVEIEPAIVSKIKERRAIGDLIVFTMDTHGQDYLNTQEGRKLPILHTAEGTPGWELHGQVAKLKQPGDVIFRKPTFGSALLFDFLRARDCRRIELCGVVTDICVLANAVLARTACPEAEIFIDRAAVASNDRQRGEAALQALSSLQVNIV